MFRQAAWSHQATRFNRISLFWYKITPLYNRMQFITALENNVQTFVLVHSTICASSKQTCHIISTHWHIRERDNTTEHIHVSKLWTHSCQHTLNTFMSVHSEHIHVSTLWTHSCQHTLNAFMSAHSEHIHVSTLWTHSCQHTLNVM